MTLEYMKQCFSGYTDAMWEGKEPANMNDARRLAGGYYDRWSTEWGVGHTYDGSELAWASVIVPDSGGVHIDVQCGGKLNVSKSGVTVCWQWTNVPEMRVSNWSRCPVKEYTKTEILRMLDKFPDTLFYRIVVLEVKSILEKEGL